MLQNFPVAVPSIDEQRRHCWTSLTARQPAARCLRLAKANDAITHLNEYRTALISAAVTGKIDVRDPLHTDAATATPHPTP